MKRSLVATIVILVTAGVFLWRGSTSAHQEAPPAGASSVAAAYQELFASSMAQKKGLTFHVGGEAIPGLVVRVIGSEGVEIKNQQHDRIVIRIDRIDALALN